MRGLEPIAVPHRSRPSIRSTSSRGIGEILVSRKRQRRLGLWQSLPNWRDRHYAEDPTGNQALNAVIQIESWLI